MGRHPILQGLLAVYLAWSGWHWFANRPVRQLDGVLAAAEPLQETAASAAVQVGRWTLTPRAHYAITARVLAREDYRFDSLADLIPEDLALGWGPMSDSRNLKRIDISQGNRFYFWHVDAKPPIPLRAIIEHSANTHVIPGDRAVAILLSRLRAGQVVTLTGDLVDGLRSDGASIKTSLVRTDSGAGACEVMLVKDVAFPQ